VKEKLTKMILTAIFASFTAVGAFLRVPMGFAAVTLQFFFTAIAGVLLGPGWGALSQLLYLLLGLIGLPVFTLGGGLSYVLQPSFGFLLGLIPAAAVIGGISWGCGLPRLIAALVVGLGVLYLVGLPYMALILTAYLGQTLSFWGLLKSGMLVFLPGDAAKLLLAALLVRRLQSRLSDDLKGGNRS